MGGVEGEKVERSNIDAETYVFKKHETLYKQLLFL